MCPSNSSTTLCNHPVQDYVYRSTNVKVRVRFCAAISATIILELFLVAAHNTIPDTSPEPKPTFYEALKASDAFITLCKKCNVWHPGKGYTGIIILQFRSHINWVHGGEWNIKSADEALLLWQQKLGEGKGKSARSEAPTNFTNKSAIVNSLEALNPPIPLIPNRPRKNSTSLPMLGRMSLGEGRARRADSDSPGLTQGRLSQHQLFSGRPPQSVPRWIQARDRSGTDIKTGLKERMDELAKQQQEHLESASKLAHEQALLWSEL
ncbi:hypothetical protein IL306_012387 [Fusarium sp. DS 682]|nr:hypothetical protein IL306_012387 [Fusarium sp. DS 682]